MISRKMDMADRGVSQPNESGSKGESWRDKFATPGWMEKNTIFYDNSIWPRFCVQPTTFSPSYKCKAEVVTENSEGKVAACFCWGYHISGWTHPHLTFVTQAAVDEYQRNRGDHKKQLTQIAEIPDHPKGSVEFNLMRTGGHSRDL
jgi:hypothetical protein